MREVLTPEQKPPDFSSCFSTKLRGCYISRYREGMKMKKRWVLLLSLLLLLLSSASVRAESWKPTRVGPPEARSSHTAVWTGSQMIVWGGYDGSVRLNTGGRYHPSTDSWTPTSTTGAPATRSGHTALSGAAPG